MQKKLIALAVAGLASTAAFAQSNVTIYGLLDASAYTSSVANQASPLNNRNYGFLSNAVASSRLGFRGVEDLGGGLKANFNLETELALTSGAMGSATAGSGAGNFTRAANVGVSSNFGTLTLGRQATPTYAAVAASDVLGANSGGLVNYWVYTNVTSAAANRLTGTATGLTNTGVGATTGVLQNAYFAGAGYASPVFAGFQAKAFVNVGNNTTGYDYSNNGIRDVAVSYANGGLKANLAYQTISGLSATNAQKSSEQKDTVFGVAYDFGQFSLGGAYASTKFDTSLTGHDSRIYSFGGKYKLSNATTLGASYSKANDTEAKANKSNTWTLMANHALSKRTDVYALFTRTANDGAAKMNGLYTGNIGAAGDNITSLAAGLKHSF